MRGVGNTEGGWDKFSLGIISLGIVVWFFLDSVRFVAGYSGVFSGMMRNWGTGFETTSMGIIFVPLFVGIIALAYDYSMKWARWLTGIGLTIVIVEILSRIRPMMNVKSSHLILMLICMAVGLGLILASYRGNKNA